MVLVPGDDRSDNLTEDRIRHLLSSETDLKAYISDNPPEACIKILLSRASKRSSKESMTIILHFIVQQFTERFSEKHIRIWAGEEVIGPENVQTVLVCFYFGSCDISMESFYDLKVIYRDYNTTDGKSALARAHELDIKSDLTPEYCDLVNEAITIHGEGLFAKHSNLEAISSSGIISSHSRGFVQEPCVILYCRVKGILPFGEMPFPKRLKVNEEVSIAVDVREGYFSFHADSQNNGQENTFNHESKMLKEPLRMGCSIGPAGRCESGTVGPFVKINTDRIGFLTCAHVVFCDSELLYLANITQTDPIVKEIVQPPDGDFAASHYQYNHRLCGKVYSAMFRGDWSPSPADKFGIDAAVIEITSRFPNAGEFVQIEETQLEDAGFSLDQPPKFDTGEIMPHPINQKIQRVVIKIGSETGLTRGLLRLTKGMVRYSISTGTLKRDKDRIEEIKITMHGLMEISSASRNKTAFCTYGDSGSGVFLVDDDDTKNKLICVGLSFGVLSDGTGLAMPIDKILTALCRDDDLQIKLNDFENEAFV
ncbi:hypothetical protein ACJMK2_001372 [Sinanodonta woodiana]|uniref:Uncharacterized protein n=1 Tax=Sinanodonta woodiana TaxID=1069815 RepID=A0ABD3XVI2_SINWO